MYIYKTLILCSFVDEIFVGEFFRSDAEDEVWENAVESFKSPRTPLTLEEACELRGNWRRHHSLENLVADQEEDRTPSRGPEYSRLFGDNCDDEESSTEVDEGMCDFVFSIY